MNNNNKNSKDIKILFLGLDKGGKSTIVAKLKEYKVTTELLHRARIMSRYTPPLSLIFQK
jgi:GTPase SAR1 family protein